MFIKINNLYKKIYQYIVRSKLHNITVQCISLGLVLLNKIPGFHFFLAKPIVAIDKKAESIIFKTINILKPSSIKHGILATKKSLSLLPLESNAKGKDALLMNVYMREAAVKWRRTSILIAVISILLFFFQALLFSKKTIEVPTDTRFGGYIASVVIEGMIEQGDAWGREMVESLMRLRDNSSVKAVILNVDSCGGSATTSEMLYNAIKKVDKVKPVITVMGGCAASGGYILSLAGRYIFSRPATITGSIGVLSDFLEFAELAKKIGIKNQRVKTSSVKGGPNPFENMTEDIKQDRTRLITDLYNWFTDCVKERRGDKLMQSKIQYILSGRAFLGSEAIKLGLVDAIGDAENARDYLYDNELVPGKIPVYSIDLVEKQKKSVTLNIRSALDAIFTFMQAKIASNNFF